jgi:hypothetical protein
MGRKPFRCSNDHLTTMTQVSNSNNPAPVSNYYVRVGPDGNPTIRKCSSSGGYPTATAAKEAKIKEIEEQIRFWYREINGLMSDIEEAKKKLEKVKRLSLEETSL